MIDNELLKEMLDAGCAPSATMLGIMSISTSLSKKTFADKKDREWLRLHRNCRYNIRLNYEMEFDNYWPTPFTPPMLVFVIFVDADHIIRFVVWVGTPPYNIAPQTDCAVLSILADLHKRGGVNRKSVKKCVNEVLGI